MDSNVAQQMDHSDMECELINNLAENDVEYPHSQELISDSVCGRQSENLSTTSETSSSEDENSLFQAADTCAPTRTRRRRRGKKRALSSLSALSWTSDVSSDFDSTPLTKEIAEFFKNPFRMWGKQKRKKKKKKKKKKSLVGNKRSQGETNSKRQYSIPSEERRRRLLDKGIPFPFAPSKHLPFRLYFTYEQFVLGGFLNHIKDLKYEHKLKKSLKDMKMDENLENENLQMRKYSYLDEDGPLSPISEPGENLNEDEEKEEEVKVVENSTFILDCQVPSKKNWQIKKKGRGKKSV